MRIFVRAKPRSKRELVRPLGENRFAVSVREAPEKGRATDAVIKALAEYFKIAPSKIMLVSGSTSKEKVFEIEP